MIKFKDLRFLICLEGENDFSGINIDFVQTKEFFEVYKDVPNFLFFDYNDVSDFLEFHQKLNFEFFFLLPFLFQNFRTPLPLGRLRQWPNWPSGMAALLLFSTIKFKLLSYCVVASEYHPFIRRSSLDENKIKFVNCAECKHIRDISEL